MILLGFDTATTATTVAVWDTERELLVEERDDPPAGTRPRHTTLLLTLAERVLARADTDLRRLDRIAVGVGPGTFTGVRIGVATARALAASLQIPIVGVSTLRALALPAAVTARAGGRVALPVLDARRGEVFAAAWAAGQVAAGQADALLTPRAVAPALLAQELAQSGTDWLAVGDGAVAFRSVLECPSIAIPDDASELHRVSAPEICRLGLDGTPATPDEVEPDYLRLPDAELNLRAREAQQTGR